MGLYQRVVVQDACELRNQKLFLRFRYAPHVVRNWTELERLGLVRAEVVTRARRIIELHQVELTLR